MTAEQSALAVKGMNHAHNIARYVYVRLTKMSQGKYDEDDLVSTAYLAACEAAVKYEASKGTFDAWLSAIVYGRCIDAMRHSGSTDMRRDYVRDAVHVPIEYGNSIEDSRWSEAIAEVEFDVYLEQITAGLSERDRYIVLAKYKGVEGQTLAKELGVDQSRISQIVTRLKVPLKWRLEHDEVLIEGRTA